jgi:hypothetical protein
MIGMQNERYHQRCCNAAPDSADAIVSPLFFSEIARRGFDNGNDSGPRLFSGTPIPIVIVIQLDE